MPHNSPRGSTTSAVVESKSDPDPAASLGAALHALKGDESFDVSGKHIWMIGIGGCGMAGLARMLKGRGALVTGSDIEQSETTDLLQREGFEVSLDQSLGILPSACDLVITTAAAGPDHPERRAASQRAIPTLLYAQALGKCMLGRTGVAIAGTHGKSTTTAMLGCTLVDCGLDPTVIVGATSSQLAQGCMGLRAEATDARAQAAQQLGTDATSPPPATGFRLGAQRIPRGFHAGEPGVLVAEACEFNRSFHNFRPRVACISSVEADHLDVFGSLDAVIDAFQDFARLLPDASEGGRLLIGHDVISRVRVTTGLRCAVETIGFSPDADWVVGFDPASRDVWLTHKRETVARWRNILPGAHNAINACTAMALAMWLGADAHAAAASLAKFQGIDRRMQLLGERKTGAGHVRVYDDYGHHPTEIDCTLRALREAERPEDRAGRLICVFQPHQHSRTRHLLDEFATSFSSADLVIVPHIYFVRDSEEEKSKVSSRDLVSRIRAQGVQALHIDAFEDVVQELTRTCRPGDVVVSMGAGPVWKVARQFLGSDVLSPNSQS